MNEAYQLVEAIKTEAGNLGFPYLGIAPAHPVPQLRAYQNWLQAGFHADMAYLARDDTLMKRGDPAMILEDCRTIISLVMPYHRPQTDGDAQVGGKGRIAAYAVTHDYHQVMREKLAQLEDFILEQTNGHARLASYVDTGPILERAYAAQAGIGIAGKNTCLLIQGVGSFFFLGEILTDLDLPADAPYTRDLCGSCRRCIDACPTGCILPGRKIDSGRCISYLTIENKGFIPDDLKPLMGSWLFGCDICQIVCPHNAWTPEHITPLGEPILPEWIDLSGLFSLSESGFKDKFGSTALSRAKRRGLLRNAAVVLGNQKWAEARPALQMAGRNESDPAILDACQYALAELD